MAMTANEKRKKLKAMMQQPTCHLAPSCNDGIQARLVEWMGLPLVHISGSGQHRSLGFADAGLLTLTEMINKAKFDSRTAYKETVHNELIKDPRFILIGRGIYALSEWGYKPGVVADVIVEILKQSNQPLTKEKIIDEVMKKRLVKRNTILVGLSNKKLFKKVGKNAYALV